MQDLWQHPCQIFFIISQKEVAELNVKIVTDFFNIKESKNIQQNINLYLAIKIVQTYLMKNSKVDSRTHVYFLTNDINKFILLLRKGIFSLWVHEWLGKVNEASLPENKGFYNNLNLEDITDVDYMHAKRICKDFEIKNSGEYLDLYLKMIYCF